MNDLATALATASQHTSRDCSQPQKTYPATASQLTPRYYVSIGRRPLAGAAVMEGCFELIVLDECHHARRGGIRKGSDRSLGDPTRPSAFIETKISEGGFRLPERMSHDF